MPQVYKTDPHYPNPWIGRAIILGLLVVVLALLAVAFLKPSSEAEVRNAGIASVADMDAAQMRADQTRAADREMN